MPTTRTRQDAVRGIAAILRNDVEQALQDLDRGSGSKSLLTKSACRGMQRASVGGVDIGDEDEEVARFCAAELTAARADAHFVNLDFLRRSTLRFFSSAALARSLRFF